VGSYTFGSLSIEVYPSSGGLTVDILDTKNRNTSNHPKLTICDYTVTSLLLFFIISGCGAYYNQPTGIEKAVIGESTPAQHY
jgi:hypothetical protein